jgi:hypothetical protein
MGIAPVPEMPGSRAIPQASPAGGVVRRGRTPPAAIRAEQPKDTIMTTGKPSPRAGDNANPAPPNPALPNPAPTQQQAGEAAKPQQQQQQGSPRFTDWASI